MSRRPGTIGRRVQAPGPSAGAWAEGQDNRPIGALLAARRRAGAGAHMRLFCAPLTLSPKGQRYPLMPVRYG